jgi:hypothetical protein
MARKIDQARKNQYANVNSGSFVLQKQIHINNTHHWDDTLKALFKSNRIVGIFKQTLQNTPISNSHWHKYLLLLANQLMCYFSLLPIKSTPPFFDYVVSATA